MSKTAFILMLITLISKITGLIREQFFAYYLGTGELIDVYSTATTIPFLLFGFIIYGVVSGFIPIYTKVEKEAGTKRAMLFTSNIVNILLIIGTMFVVMIYIFAPILISIFAPGYAGLKRELSINFTKIVAFGLYPTIVAAIFIGLLQIKGKFVVAEVQGIFMNFFHVTFLVLSFYFKNFYIVAFGFLVTEYIKYFLFPKALKKEGYKHVFKINLKDKYLKSLLDITIPVLAMGALDLTLIADQALASVLVKDGGVSAMKYGVLIIQLISGVVTVSITTAIYPTLSRFSADNDLKNLKKTLMDGLVFAFVFIIPSIIGVMILAEPMIRLLFQRGSFNIDSTKLSSGILFFYAPTLMGNAMTILFNRANYSLGDGKLPIQIALTQVVIGLIFNFVFSYFIGINGLALATSSASILSGSLAIYKFTKKYGSLNLKSFLKSVLKIFTVSIIMGIITNKTFYGLLKFGEVKALFISIIVSMTVYLLLIIFMRIPFVMTSLNQIYKKLKKKKK